MRLGPVRRHGDDHPAVGGLERAPRHRHRQARRAQQVAGLAGHPDAEPNLSAADIVQRALHNLSPLCSETIECFCGMLGTMASDLALTLGASGGIFVGGGIVPRLGELFALSPFRERFEAKGRFSGFVARIPTYVLTADNPSFLGVSSLTLLTEAYGQVRAAGWRLVNADCVLVGEEPRIAGRREEMRRRLAGAIGEGEVNVRATTTDHLGFTGRGEGLAAHAVALLERR